MRRNRLIHGNQVLKGFSDFGICQIFNPCPLDRHSAAASLIHIRKNQFAFTVRVSRIDNPVSTVQKRFDKLCTGKRFTFRSNAELFSARHVQNIARFDPGDPYMASDVEDLRRAIVATGLVSSVTLKPTDAGDGAAAPSPKS